MQEPSIWAEPRTWVIVAFIIFFVLFGRKLWMPMGAMLDSRATAVRAELEEAARLRREAEAMLRDAQVRRDASLQEATALIEGARAEAQRVTQAAAAEAEQAARRREQMALDRIAAAEKAAVTEVRVAATEIAASAAELVIRGTLGADADAALVDHAIAGLPAALSRKAA